MKDHSDKRLECSIVHMLDDDSLHNYMSIFAAFYPKEYELLSLQFRYNDLSDRDWVIEMVKNVQISDLTPEELSQFGTNEDQNFIVSFDEDGLF
jgi:hypothetical protein